MYRNTETFAAAYIANDGDTTDTIFIRYCGEDGSQEDCALDESDMGSLRAFIRGGGDVTVRTADGRERGISGDVVWVEIVDLLDL